MKSIEENVKMKEFDRLVEIIKVLRGENGCPWDKVQTLKSLKPCLVEETAEVLEAMEGDPEEHKGELGDLLMNIVFQADIREDAGDFNIEDVSKEVCEKLIRRHPHVFKEKQEGLTPEETLLNWEAIKKTEKAHQNRKSAIDGIPIYLPALAKAQKIQKKASKAGFDWNKDDISKVVDKIYEELDEVKAEMVKKDQEKCEEEIGDLLFAVVNLARFLDVDATQALEGTIKKFDRRFRYVEKNCDMEKSDLTQMDKLWEEAKALEKK